MFDENDEIDFDKKEIRKLQACHKIDFIKGVLP